MIQIAGDESGSDGENLITPTHQFFTYGTVDLSKEEASSTIENLRRAIGSTKAEADSAGELKSSGLVKKHRRVLAEFLSPEGALGKHASVYVADKSYFLTCKLISLFVEEQAYFRGVNLGPIVERELANELHDEVRLRVDPTAWSTLLDSFNRLVRYYKVPAGKAATSYEFMKALNCVRRSLSGEPAADSLRMLWDARGQANEYGNGTTAPEVRYLEPMVPVLLAATSSWTARHPGEKLELVADEHSALTVDALDLVRRAAPVFGSALHRIRTVDSKSDPRIQLADVVAGAGRHVAEVLQSGTTDELTTATLHLFDRGGFWSNASPIEVAVRGQ
jgi:hypothetical protein